jgi:hypothetical protein
VKHRLNIAWIVVLIGSIGALIATMLIGVVWPVLPDSLATRSVAYAVMILGGLVALLLAWYDRNHGSEQEATN